MYDIFLPILLTVLFIFVNAFFVLAEFSLIRVRGSRLEELVRQGNRAAVLVQKAQKNLNAYLAAVQLGITMASLVIGWIGEPAFEKLIELVLPALNLHQSPALAHALSFIFAFSIITAMHIIFGEQSPKLFAIQHADRISMMTIYPLTGFYYATYAPMWVLDTLATGVARLLGYKGTKGEPLHSDEEIRILLDEREEAGKLSLDRLMMFENLFDFGAAKVRDAMTPRSSVVILALDDAPGEVLRTLQENRYSRFPICTTRARGLDEVIGYLHVKDALNIIIDKKKLDLRTVAKQLKRIGEDVSLEECLGRFQEKRVHIALVVDTAGAVTGLVALEDLVEEIVGEIRDEYDDVPPLLLSKVLVPDAIRIGLPDVFNRYDVIRTMLSALYTARPVFDLAAAETGVCIREKTLTTAIGSSAAIPHARCPGIARPLVGFATLPDGMEWHAPDGQAVRVVFLILTPITMPSAQVTILAGLARLLSTPTLRDRLIEAQSPEDVMEAVEAAEEKIPD